MDSFEPGDEFECLSIPIKVVKEKDNPKLGMKIAGGIDQDHKKSPQKFNEPGVYVTGVDEDGVAFRSGLRVGDRILQCNGHDFTLVTNQIATQCLAKYDTLNLLIDRQDVGVKV